jgi:hypothetical protein
VNSQRRIPRLHPTIPLQVLPPLRQRLHRQLLLLHRLGGHTLPRPNALSGGTNEGGTVMGEEGEEAADFEDLPVRGGVNE